ncbi:MAG: hypothetical protein ACP6IY_18115 [Promethearchaeia archaeon]
MPNSNNIRIDETLFKRFRPVLSLYLKRGFLISSRELNGDLDGFLPGEADWIIEWFKEEFEKFYHKNLEKHIELVNQNKIELGDNLISNIKRSSSQNQTFPIDKDKKLLECPACKKAIYLSDINLRKVEDGKLIDCIIFHPRENGTEDHVLMMYLDKHLNVRGKKIIENVSF